MAPLVSARRRALVLAVAPALALSGCTTTQHTAERVRLESARQFAALKPTRVTVTSRVVAVTDVGLVRGSGRTAFVVSLRNNGSRAVSDLPISVGYSGPSGPATYLNAGSNLTYFQAHLPAIRAGGKLTWVFTTPRPVPPGSHPFARVGTRPAAPAKLTEMNVRIDLSDARPTGMGALAVRLQNPTGVPQYQLQVYAYAERAGHYLVAGCATVADLEAGASRSLKLELTGPATSGLHVEAVPTILQ